MVASVSSYEQAVLIHQFLRASGQQGVAIGKFALLKQNIKSYILTSQITVEILILIISYPG